MGPSHSQRASISGLPLPSLYSLYGQYQPQHELLYQANPYQVGAGASLMRGQSMVNKVNSALPTPPPSLTATDLGGTNSIKGTSIATHV